ncbi:MAG: hypothetical protein IKY75_01195 [Bacteroidaceae bacterium]|nr:hypothetical protein [Bacteroidaceae bacterium]
MENKDYQFVDLGLTVKWASCNVGADTPEEYGDFFSWGDIETKPSYTGDSCRTYERAVYRGGKYSPYKKGIDEICTDAEYDAARANWGGAWHMPTKAHMDELVSRCSWEWVELGEVKGYKVTGPSGNSIFLPAAGWLYGSSHTNVGVVGAYWCSTPIMAGNKEAYRLLFANGEILVQGYNRYCGFTVRPVCE